MGVREAERLIADFRGFESTGSQIIDLNLSIADKIGELCAKHNTRIRPDVIIVASALTVHANAVATRDIEHFKPYQQETWIAEPEEILSSLPKP